MLSACCHYLTVNVKLLTDSREGQNASYVETNFMPFVEFSCSVCRVRILCVNMYIQGYERKNQITLCGESGLEETMHLS
jgi:hypothetical protein